MVLLIAIVLSWPWLAAQQVSPALQKTLQMGGGYVETIAYSPINNMLAVAKSDRTIDIYSLTTGERLRTCSGHRHNVICLAFSPDGRFLASGSHDHRLIIWDADLGTAKQTLQKHLQAVTAVAFSLDNTMLASGSDDKTVVLWNTSNYSTVAILTGHIGGIKKLRFTADNKMLFSWSRDNTIKLWRLQEKGRTNVANATPESPKDYNNRGSLRRAKGDFAGAIADYIQATRLDVQFNQAYYNLASAYSLRSTTHPKTPEGQKSAREDINNGLEYLAQALKRGYDKWENLQQDSTLYPLRSDARYLQMITPLVDKSYPADKQNSGDKQAIGGGARPISFKILEKDGSLHATAHEILVNGKPIKPGDKFFPGYDYDIVVRFKQYQTVQQRIQIVGDQGPVVLYLPLVSLKIYEFRARRGEIIIDSIIYPYVCYADGKKIEDHLVTVERRGVFYYYKVAVPLVASDFRITGGYHYEQIPFASLNGRFVKADDLGVSLLVQHLKRLTKKSQYGYQAAIYSLEKLMKSFYWSRKLKYAPIREIEELLDYITSWSLNDEQDRMRVQLLIDAISQLYRK